MDNDNQFTANVSTPVINLEFEYLRPMVMQSTLSVSTSPGHQPAVSNISANIRKKIKIALIGLKERAWIHEGKPKQKIL
jgi:hypothetical protein